MRRLSLAPRERGEGGARNSRRPGGRDNCARRVRGRAREVTVDSGATPLTLPLSPHAGRGVHPHNRAIFGANSDRVPAAIAATAHRTATPTSIAS